VGATDARAALRQAAQRLLAKVDHWGSARWAQPADQNQNQTRADEVSALVQQLADLAADAEGHPRRLVPRPEHDGGLPDQVRVMVSDLLAAMAPDEVLLTAAAKISAIMRLDTRHAGRS
jgi:hypothetical protein